MVRDQRSGVLVLDGEVRAILGKWGGASKIRASSVRVRDVRRAREAIRVD